MVTVPNSFPISTPTRRLAIIGEAPGEREQVEGKPFVGPSGQLLTSFLSHAGIDRDACFVGNVTGHRPPGNKIELFKWQGEEIQGGLKQLADDLRRFQPHFVLCLGGTALRAFAGEKRSIDDWRGSLFVTSPDSPFPGVKAMSTFHPARVLREFGLTGVVRFDLKRCAEESRSDALVVPEDYISVDGTHAHLLNLLAHVHETRTRVAIDIEGWVDFVSCIGFATGHNTAFVVPFMRADGTSRWTEDEEVALWEAVAAVLQDPLVPKVLQNSLYDCFVLAWSYGIVIEGIVDDTMLKHFELFCELEKGLGFQTSIYTKHPFYKFQRKSDDERVQLEYCGRDCCRTLECCDAQEAMLKPQQREHYRFNMSLLAPLLYMELRGIRYDHAEAQRRLAATQQTIYELQDQINREAAGGRPALARFYEALRVPLSDDPPVGRGDSTVQAETRGNMAESSNKRNLQVDGHELGGVESLLPLLTAAFCAARRTEKREVEEVTWQPMRWSCRTKKWIKGGKRQTTIPPDPAGLPHYEGDETPLTEGITGTGLTWWKPHRKLVTRNVPVEVETLEDVRRFCKDSCRDTCKAAIGILRGQAAGGHLSPAQRGELSTLLGIEVKINSTGAGGDAQWYLYEHCKLPPQFQKEGNRLTDRLASDDEAIIKAYLKSGRDDASRDKRAMVFLRMRRAVTQTKFLAAEPDADGRIRSAMNLVATPTCRMAMYGSPTGTSDLNLQTIGKGLRDLFLADEGCYIGQRDLSNSDAYTVAAFCAMLGDTTMLDDLRAKIKPANVLARIYEVGSSVNQMTREQLREECKQVDGEGWLYFACKRVLHGSNYGMGKVTMANQILTDSFKLLGEPIWLEPAACERIQERAFFVRYPGVRRWHEWMGRELREKGVLVTSTGFQRRVFGRKDDHSTLKELLAHYPQYFTTLAIKSTLLSPRGAPRQWDDPENRRADGSLRVEPLLLVHDSNVSQWRVEDTDFARAKLSAWFQNEVVVANQTLTIPAGGTFGPSWGEQSETL